MPVYEIFGSSEHNDAHLTGIEKYFWSLARSNVVYEPMLSYLKEGDLAMHAGCGKGILIDEMQSRGLNIRGLELRAAPLMPGLEKNIDTCMTPSILPKILDHRPLQWYQADAQLWSSICALYLLLTGRAGEYIGESTWSPENGLCIGLKRPLLQIKY